MYNNLYYDRQNKRFYVIEPHTHDAGGILVVDNEEYVDVTDEILELLLEHSKDDKQLLCIETNSQLPDTIHHDGKKFIYIGNPWPSVVVKSEEDENEKNPNMIQWTGDNLKEVIDFTGMYSKFGKWFKSWDEYKNYVRSHNDIFKLFCNDGSHYEVPKGAWIVKTPDGYNVASRSKFVQKPAEWSEEDEKMIKDLLWICDGLEQGYNDFFHKKGKYAEIRDWLKSLRGHSEKPNNQWSDEDEDMLGAIEACYKLKLPLQPEHFNFIKSLRPHWKPSKEQMSALHTAIYVDEMGLYGGLKDWLLSLYNDLKKL